MSQIREKKKTYIKEKHFKIQSLLAVNFLNNQNELYSQTIHILLLFMRMYL